MNKTPLNKDTNKFHYNIYWYLTYKCNLSCKHCWINCSPNYEEKILSTERLIQIAKQISSLPYKPHVILSGGEPLLCKDLYKIINILTSFDITTGIESNGLLLNQDFLDSLSKESKDRLSLAISLDGGTSLFHDRIRGNGTFEKTLYNLKNLKQIRIPFDLQCVVNAQNVYSLPKLITLAENLNVENLTLAFLHPLGRAKSEMNDLVMKKKDFDKFFKLVIEYGINKKMTITLKAPPALIPANYLLKFQQAKNINIVTNCDFPKIGITPSGDVTLCSLVKEKLTFGNVFNQDLTDIIIKNNLSQIRTDYLKANLDGICSNCVFKERCKGSCRSYAYFTTDSFFKSHPVCSQLAEDGLFPEYYMKNPENKNIFKVFQKIKTEA